MTTPTAPTQLPTTLQGQPNPTPGVAPFTAGSVQNIQQMQQQYQQQMQKQIQDKGLDQADLGSAIMHPLEWVGSKAYWLYSNAISHPLSTAIIAGQEEDVNHQSLFSGSTWDEAWDLAKKVSPGQAAYVDARGFFNESWEKKQLINQNTDGTLIWNHPDQVESTFNHGSQQWISGGLDTLAGFYLDPISLAAKGLKYTKDVSYTKAAVTTANQTMAGAATSSLIGAAGRLTGAEPEAVQAAKAAWADRLTTVNTKTLASNLNGSNFTKFGDYIEANKTRLGDQFPSWAAKQPWAQQGAMSGTMASAFANATDRSEIDGVIKAGLGDTDHLAQLTAKNAELGSQLVTARKAVNDWQANMPKFPDPMSPAGQQYQKQMAAYVTQLNMIEQQTGKIGDQLAVQRQLQNGLYFNGATSPLAAKVMQAGSAAYDYGNSGNIIYNNMFVRPVRLFQSVGNAWSDVLPNGWIKLDDPNSHRELDAQLRESGVYSPSERTSIVSDYIKAPYSLKRQQLMNIEAKTVARLAANSGMDEEGAKAIYNVFNEGRVKSIGGNLYSTAQVVSKANPSEYINASHIEDDGNLVMVHPILQTQLENNHVMMDFKKMSGLLKSNGRAFQRLINEGKSAEEAAEGVKAPSFRLGYAWQKSNDAYNSFSDMFNHIWKFNAHVRLGYGPRQLADDFLGQAARLNAVTIAQNAVTGLKGQFLRHSSWLYDSSGYEAKLLNLNTGVSSLEDQLEDAKGLHSRISGYTTSTPKGAARKASLLNFHQGNIDDLDAKLSDLKTQRAALKDSRSKLIDKNVFNSSGQVVPGFGEGAQGRLFVDMNGLRNTINSALGGTAADTLNNFRSELGQKTYYANEPKHLSAWLNTVQKQIQNDPAAMMAVRGKSEAEIASWLRGHGSQYYKAVAQNATGTTGGKITNWSVDELADRIKAHVDKYLPISSPEFRNLRTIVGNAGDDKSVAEAMKATPQAYRPVVHGPDYGVATGQNSTMHTIDRAISRYYKLTSEMPVNVLSRNPLASTLYRSHVKEAFAIAEAQGKTHFTNAELDAIAESSRRLAVRDVKKFTYNMDFETKVQHAMRFLSPFFGAGQEAINRWGRILADKPDTLGKMAALYTAPMRIGKEYTYNGVPIVDGYSIDPSTGKKYLVPADETMIRFQMPGFMAKALGYTQGSSAEIPLSSLMLPFRNEPWFNPGEGPIVEMAANKFAMSEPPSVGDFLTKIGVLPTGLQQSSMSMLYGSLLSSIQSSNADGSTAATTLQAMQDLNYQWEQGLLSKQPTWADAVARGQHMASMKAWFKGTSILPFSMDFQDPYQFFRDQYNTMVAANPTTADQQFYAKYGDSAYSFTANLNKNNIPGIPATNQSQILAKRFSNLIDQDPNLAGVIIGSQGSGAFSQTAYEQQIASGQRTKQTPEQAWDQMQTNLGWDQYSSFMNNLNAQLFNRGLTTFNDKGAADLLAQKQAFIKVLSSPTLLDGVTPNHFYNAQWTEAYDSYDPSKANAQALALEQIATAKELQGRPDIQGLQQYLSLRATVQNQLAINANEKSMNSMSAALSSLSGDINAKSNEGLKSWFQQNVMSLIQSNTAFQTLHDKYLSNDIMDVYDGTNMVNSITNQQ